MRLNKTDDGYGLELDWDKVVGVGNIYVSLAFELAWLLIERSLCAFVKLYYISQENAKKSTKLDYDENVEFEFWKIRLEADF